MPYQCNDNEPVYIEKLGILKAIIDELDNTCLAMQLLAIGMLT